MGKTNQTNKRSTVPQYPPNSTNNVTNQQRKNAKGVRVIFMLIIRVVFLLQSREVDIVYYVVRN